MGVNVTMNIHERLHYLRTHLNLTYRAFGESINLTAGAVSNMEKGTRAITERTVRDICREYNVNPDWLLNGNEPIFEYPTQTNNNDEEIQQLVQQYSLLNNDDKEVVQKMILFLSERTTS